jgi:hypothetical protein
MLMLVGWNFEWTVALLMHYTFQIWDIRTHKLKMDLPGHADEVSRCFDKIELVINNIVVLLRELRR